MAKILYIEDNSVAVRAMEGIIRRSPHVLVTVDSVEKASKLLAQSLDYDLIIAELKLSSGSVLPLVREVRANLFLKAIPVLIYSGVKDRDAVKSVLDVGVQNFLFKPYKESAIYEEINKYTEHDWRIKLSGANKKFFHALDSIGLSFHGRNKEVLYLMQQLGDRMFSEKSLDSVMALKTDIEFLMDKAEGAAFPLFAEYLKQLLDSAFSGNQGKAIATFSLYQYAIRLQEYRILYIQRELKISDKEEESVEEAEIEEVEAVSLDITRHLSLEEVDAQVEKISSYPVIESAAAAFQMSTHDEDTNLDDIVAMIQKDSGLATSVLRFANMSAISPGSVIEDIHQAIAVLGLKRIRLLALSLKTIPEMSSMFTAFKWEKFWMHQVGCAMLAEEISRRLDLSLNGEVVYIAGLINDMGKILLNEVDAELYKQIVAYSLKNNVSLHLKEREYFGCSHEHAGLVFAKKSMLPESLQFAIRYQFEPEKAPEHKDLVAIICLANFLCVSYEIGDNGDRLLSGNCTNLADHPVWKILEPCLTPGFSIPRFTREMELRIRSLKVELTGLAQEQVAMKSRSR